MYSLLLYYFISSFFLFYYSKLFILFFFFFSSRRRHTRWNCDWSSDVCSSDLERHSDADLTRPLRDRVRRDPVDADGGEAQAKERETSEQRREQLGASEVLIHEGPRRPDSVNRRSEERRVGKECRCRWAP